MEEKIRFAAGNISRKRERVALYARLSTDGKTPETPLQELQKIADQNGGRVVREFVDQGISLSKGKDKRPKFDEMSKGVKEGDFDLIMTWSVDRLGRSLRQLITFLDELTSGMLICSSISRESILQRPQERYFFKCWMFSLNLKDP